MEDNLWWKTTFGGRQPSVEDNLQWKTTCGERQPVVEDDLHGKTTIAASLHSALGYFQQPKEWAAKNLFDKWLVGAFNGHFSTNFYHPF